MGYSLHSPESALCPIEPGQTVITQPDSNPEKGGPPASRGSGPKFRDRVLSLKQKSLSAHSLLHCPEEGEFPKHLGELPSPAGFSE